MPRNVWSVAGDELQGFAKYMDQREAQDTRARQYNDMVELRKQNLIRQMERDARQLERDRATDLYREEQQRLAAERDKYKMERDKINDQYRQYGLDLKAEKRAAREKMGQWALTRMQPPGEGQQMQPITREELRLKAFSLGMDPEDYQEYEDMLFKDQRRPGSFDEEQYRLKKEIDAEYANNKPEKPRYSTDYIKAQEATPEMVRNLMALEAQNQYYVGKSKRDVLGNIDPDAEHYSREWRDVSKILRNIKNYRGDLKMVAQSSIDEFVQEILATNPGLDPNRPPDWVFEQATERAFKALNQATQGSN